MIELLPCRRCGGAMAPGGGEVVTMSPGGPGEVVVCLNCVKCGWSVTAPGESEVDRLRRENDHMRATLAELRAHLSVHERLNHEHETAAQRDARVMAWRRLYVAANDLACFLSVDGKVDACHWAARAFLQRLADLDDGTIDMSISGELDGTAGDVR